MALKILMLNKRKRDLLAKMEDVTKREADLKIREEELAGAIDEATTEEEQKVVEEEVEVFEADKSTLEAEKKELQDKIAEIDTELEELDEKSVEVVPEEEVREVENKIETRGATQIMDKRKIFGGYTRAEAVKLVERDDVKEFLTRTREFVSQKRAVTGADLLIPEVLIGIMRDEIHKYSKLLSKVWLRPVSGTARVILPGTIPEAVWTEACATLNELAINFNQMELDGYKVGGYIAVCNATLADASDVDLYDEIMYMLAQAIGLGIDKAIVYGTGVKMPLGIVTRLAQATQPAGYPSNARPWVNLSATNIVAAAGATGEAFFADFIVKAGAAKSNYSDGNKIWIMNESTLATLQSKVVTFNAAGAVVASINNAMPIVNGEIIILPFIPNGDVIGGYAKNYLLVERAGMALAQSEHVQFIQDNTVFKGTARYDGAPAIAEAFVAINIAGGTVTTTVEFAPDSANPGV